MSKRRAPSDHECRCTAKRARRPKHLYVVLDDQDKAFSVHKVDVDTLADAEPAAKSCERLPEPSFLRLEVLRRRESCHFASLGGKIVAFHTNRPLTLVHDTETGTLAIGSPPPPALSTHGFLAVAAAGRLYTLPGMSARTAGDMYCLEEYGGGEEEEMRRSWREKQDKWVWSTVASPMPFDPRDVTCHALHPDGRTLFVSVKRQRHTLTERGTFSLDADRFVWTRHGDWLLPFAGQAFYDADLDAWVGLDERGYLCSSNGLSRHATRRTPPAWKRGMETMLREADPDRRLGAVLVYMGDGGRFCLVERAVREGVKARHSSLGDGDRCVLHITTFCVRYGKGGELTTTARRGVQALSAFPRACILHVMFPGEVVQQ